MSISELSQHSPSPPLRQDVTEKNDACRKDTQWFDQLCAKASFSEHFSDVRYNAVSSAQPSTGIETPLPVGMTNAKNSAVAGGQPLSGTAWSQNLPTVESVVQTLHGVWQQAHKNPSLASMARFSVCLPVLGMLQVNLQPGGAGASAARVLVEAARGHTHSWLKARQVSLSGALSQVLNTEVDLFVHQRSHHKEPGCESGF